MITKKTISFDGKYVISFDAINNELGSEITKKLIAQIKKDVLNFGVGKEIFPSSILSENSGSWRKEYQAVYDYFKEKYKTTHKNPWDQARKYIGKIFKYVIHNECDGNFVIYTKEKFGTERTAYLRIE